MTALSRHGAKVLSIDAAELAEQSRLPVRVRHAALAGQGTLVRGDRWPGGPVACATSKNGKGSSVALIGRALPEHVRERARSVLGPGVNEEDDAMVLHSVPHERAGGLLRELHAAVGLA